MDLTWLHGQILGWAIVLIWPVVGFWSLALRFAGYEEAPTFWRVVSVAQILLGIQLVVGLVLLALGRLPGPAQDPMRAWTLIFHLLYGVIFPLVVLVVAHRGAHIGRFNPYSAFAVVGLVNFGLTFRAMDVGLAGFGG